MDGDICKIFGNNVKKYRKTRNITQIELADKIGLEVKSLSLIETGKGFASAKTIGKIVTVLKVTPDELFTPQSDKNSKIIYSEIVNNLDLLKDDTRKLQTVSLVVKSLL